MLDWLLLFAGYLSYSELWGPPDGGLTPFERMELHIAYEEWQLYQRESDKHAREVKRLKKDTRDLPEWNNSEYIADRLEEIESEAID